jgi:translation elongation factor EF-1alpha
MNQERQEYIDNYNNNLLKELSVYGNNYDRIVSVINDDRMYAGRTDLLHVDTGAIYQQQKLEFKPSTNKFGIGEIQSHTEAVKSTLNKEAADRFGVDINQYHEIKQKAGEILKQTNQPITQETVQEIKQQIEQKQDSSS